MQPEIISGSVISVNPPEHVTVSFTPTLLVFRSHTSMIGQYKVWATSRSPSDLLFSKSVLSIIG